MKNRPRFAFVVPKPYQENRLFDLADLHLNRDNCLFFHFRLKRELETHGFEVATSDIFSEETADTVLYLDAPLVTPLPHICSKSFLFLQESEVILKHNWDSKNHALYKGVFTWHSNLTHKLNYISYRWPQNIVAMPQWNDSPMYLAGLIASNKQSTHPLELYTAREQVIQWFEKNAPQNFAFYGMDWDLPQLFQRIPFSKTSSLAKKIDRRLSRIPGFKKSFCKKYLCYGGKVDDKYKALQQFKFTICYENALDIPGYVTEKIFDCLVAGSVPVYWGAQDISSFVPASCFVDRREFNSTSDLVSFLRGMSALDYNSYRNSIKEFLLSENAARSSSRQVAAGVVASILAMKGALSGRT